MDIKALIERMSVPSGSTLRHAMRVIDQAAYGCALIFDVETRRFAGIVTDGDIRRALLSGVSLDDSVAAVPRPAAKTGRIGMAAQEISALMSAEIRVMPLLDEGGRVADLVLLDRRIHLPVTEPLIGDRELQYVTECLLSGWISSAGKFVTEFEQRFAEFTGSRYAISTCNGTSALHLALLALGIGPGDEVIVPSLTFIATANAVTYTGARPIMVDSETETWNLDPAQVERAVTSRTRAVIPVHLYGHPAEMGGILDVARRHGLAVVEDAAEAHGARFKSRVVGSLADAAVFSFYGNKIVTTGEGGMVTTSRPDVAERVRILRDHGMDPGRRYWHSVLGFNHRLTNLQAAVGVAQMERIDVILAAKRRTAAAYDEGLRGVPGVTLPPRAAWAEPVFWLYSILIDAGRFGCSRDELMARLTKAGIDTRPLFPPVHTQPIYDTGQSLPVAESISATGLSLPSAVGLRDDDVARVIASIRGAQLARA